MVPHSGFRHCSRQPLGGATTGIRVHRVFPQGLCRPLPLRSPPPRLRSLPTVLAPPRASSWGRRCGRTRRSRADWAGGRACTRRQARTGRRDGARADDGGLGAAGDVWEWAWALKVAGGKWRASDKERNLTNIPGGTHDHVARALVPDCVLQRIHAQHAVSLLPPKLKWNHLLEVVVVA